MRTLNNTKSNGRREARAMITNGGGSPNWLRLLAALWLTREEGKTSRHFAAGFAEEIFRLTCWMDDCDKFKHDGDRHTDATGYEWTQPRGTKYCTGESEYMPVGHACVDDATDE